jgi:hypothetical protein
MHNEDFYRSAILLANMAEKYNWLLVIKPKKSTVSAFISRVSEIDDEQYDWAREIKDEYLSLGKRDHVSFISPDQEAYRYFCTDAIISTARSSIEIEAALARKPLVIIYTNSNDVVGDDVHETLKYDAAYLVDDLNMLESKVLLAVNGNNAEITENQKKFTEYLKMSCDGKAHDRIIEAALKLIEK